MTKMMIRKLNRKQVILLFGAVVLLLIGLLAAALFVFPFLRIRSTGIVLKPSHDIPVHEITYYLQNDPEWGSDMIGSSRYKMSSSGCLLTCVASALSELTTSVNPAEINKLLTTADGFEGGDLLWYKIHEVLPEVDYEYSRTFSANTIEAYLNKGYLPIVKVKMHGYGATHWVLIVGSMDGDFLIMDPLNQDKELLPLATHGRVYAFRVLVVSE